MIRATTILPAFNGQLMDEWVIDEWQWYYTPWGNHLCVYRTLESFSVCFVNDWMYAIVYIYNLWSKVRIREAPSARMGIILKRENFDAAWGLWIDPA